MTDSGTVAGYEGCHYFNSATYGSPTWVPMPNVKDSGLPLEWSEESVAIKGNGGWNATEGVIKDAPIEFQMQHRKASGAYPADIQKMLDCWTSGELVDMLILDGPEDVAGSTGIRAWMRVLKFKRNEPVSGLMTIDVKIAPGLGPNAPEEVEMT